MANTINHGNTTFQEQGVQINSVPGKSSETIRKFRGDEANMRQQATLLFAQGYSTNLTQTQKGELWELVATLSAETSVEPEPQWEIIPHTVERNILECTDRAFIQALTTETKDLIEYAIKNPANHIGLTVDGQEADPAQFNNAWLVYNLMRAGVEARQEWTVAVRRTITVSRNYSANWSLANNGKVLSKATLVNAYGIPAYISNLLPVGSAAIENAGTNISPIYVFYGYLEQRPTYQSIAGNKIQISQEWLFNRWSAGDSGLYDVA
jgi:hypothetical protein